MVRFIGFLVAAAILVSLAGYGLTHTDQAAVPMMAAALAGLFCLSNMKSPIRRWAR